jgi:type VI secretion system (T6SS) effector TldE1-like protein
MRVIGRILGAAVGFAAVILAHHNLSTPPHTSTPSSTPPHTEAVAAVLPPGTAVYDISTHTVILPDGRKLEAHSGRGNGMDNVKLAHIRNIGPTPPNLYVLSVRERRFHGARALRLNPVDPAGMHGRDGILAHPYLERRPGASHGCVAIRNYPAFLDAFMSGAVRFLKVVAS